MTRTVVIVIVVVVAMACLPAIARADCKQVGPNLLEVTRETNGVVTETTTLWASGAWTFVQPPIATPPEAEVRAGGCLDAKVAAALTKDLAAIDWTIQHPQLRCRARSPDTVEYGTAGRHRVTQTTCGAERLDDKSTELLAGVTGALDAATASLHRPRHVPPPRRPTPALPADPQQPPTTVQP